MYKRDLYINSSTPPDRYIWKKSDLHEYPVWIGTRL